jgi:hypothetical protein
MNVSEEAELLEMFDRLQCDHPHGQIAARYVEQAMQRLGRDPDFRRAGSNAQPEIDQTATETHPVNPKPIYFSLSCIR